MGKKNISQHNRDILHTHRDIDHSSLKKAPKYHGDLAYQIREKILVNMTSTPKYAVDFSSKTFGQIRLKEVRDPEYTADDIRGFFSALDFVEKVYVVVDNKTKPYVTSDDLFVIKLGVQKHTLPVSLFRISLPKQVKDRFKTGGSFYRIYISLFTEYGRKLIPIEYK